jgi:hypothetical protein
MLLAVPIRFPTVALALLAGSAVGRAVRAVALVEGAGRPIVGAAVGVESAAARAAVRPLAQVEVVRRHRQFIPEVTLVPSGPAGDAA